MTYINSDVLPELTWASRLGASSRCVSLPGTRVLGAGSGAGLSAIVAHAVPRVRGGGKFFAPPTQQDVVAALLGQTNIHNYMTRVYAVGEGASGPPREEPV